jgi:hypothetical protein
MTAGNDWEQWERSWRAVRATPAELDGLLARTRRARRNLVAMRVLSMVIAIVALIAVAMALWHAANRFEAALGIVVGLAIATAWLVDALVRDHDADGADAPEEQYRATRALVCVRQLRFARLGWIVVALVLVFLIPWWAAGIRVHGMGLGWLRIVSLWAPLAAISIFVWWTFRIRARALAEQRALATLAGARGGLAE